MAVWGSPVPQFPSSPVPRAHIVLLLAEPYIIVLYIGVEERLYNRNGNIFISELKFDEDITNAFDCLNYFYFS